jgi:hypothetical protein
MTAACMALWGDFSCERLAVSSIGDEFHWSVCPVSSIGDLTRLSQDGAVVAVLVHPATLGLSWREALHYARTAAPQARVAICHGIETAEACSEMTEAGAFGTLLLPLVRIEVHHLLGFVWASLPEARRVVRETVTPLTSANDARIGG